MITTPPRLNGLWKQQQSFKNSVNPFMWNYIIETNCEEEDCETSEGITIAGRTLFSSPQCPSVTMTSMAAAAITPILSMDVGNKKRKTDEDNPLLYSADGSCVPRKKYPLLAHALGHDFDPTDRATKTTMQSLLAELVDLLSSQYELSVNNSANNKLSFVRVPKTASD